jgi:exosome complex exonuclease RRP6
LALDEIKNARLAEDAVSARHTAAAHAVQNQQAVSKAAWNASSATAAAASSGTTPAAPERRTNYSMFSGRFVERPQLKFSDRIDNSRTARFVPRISSKPNAIAPLQDCFHVEQPHNHPLSHLGASARPPQVSTAAAAELLHLQDDFPHPYAAELDAFEPTDDLFGPVQASPPAAFEDTPFSFVNSLDDLHAAIAHLNNHSEVAIDLENHSYRSFQGFLCLMQLSTRDKDFVIDTIALRSHMHLFLDLFTNPTVVKVFHGADSDIVWLQRDFGLYLVNMFDTGQAARLLNKPSFSLAYLLRTYCNFEADKQYQLADWRLRPIPEVMLKYARSDTHFLLYIYDCIRNELAERDNASHNVSREVWRRSTSLCLKRYQKEEFSLEACERIIQERRLQSNLAKVLAIRAIFDWRDRMARDEDESVHYVLPKHMMISIVERLPKDVPSLLACCTPIPPLVRMAATDLVGLITEAQSAAAVAAAAGYTVSVAAAAASAPVKRPTHVRFGDAEDDDEDEDHVKTRSEALLPTDLSPVEPVVQSAPAVSPSSALGWHRVFSEVRSMLPSSGTADTCVRTVRRGSG